MCQNTADVSHNTIQHPLRLPDSGDNVHVYIIDSGINSLSTFDQRLSSTINTTGRADKDTVDHGTSIASIIGSTTFGVASKPFLHSCKVDNLLGRPDTKATKVAILEVIKQHHQRRANDRQYKGAIINLSMDIQPELEATVVLAIQAGVAVVMAMGNDSLWLGSSVERVNPCRWNDAAITVGAVDKDRRRASCSNYHQDMTIFAPGKDVSGYGACGRARHDLSGTSFACAYVTGVIATFMSQEVDCSPYKTKLLLILNADRGVIEGLPASKKLPNLLANNGYGKDDTLPYKGHGMTIEQLENEIKQLDVAG